MSEPAKQAPALSTEFFKDFALLASLSSEQLHQLATVTNGDAGFASDEAASTALAMTLLQRSKPEAERSLSAAAFLYQIVREGVPFEPLFEQLMKESRENDVPPFGEKKAAFAALVTPKPAAVTRLRTAMYQAGIIPQLAGISVTMELRAVLASTFGAGVLGFVPMAVIRLSAVAKDAVAAQQSTPIPPTLFTSQVDSEGLAALIDRLVACQKQLAEVDLTARKAGLTVLKAGAKETGA